MLSAQPAISQTSIRETDQALGKRFEITPESLPEPNPKEAVSNPPVTIHRAGREPQVPMGFTATLFADRLTNPRQMLVLPNGDVLVAEEDANHIMLLRDADYDGKAEFVEIFAKGFDGPYGLAYRDGEVLVADTKGIWTVTFREGQVRADPGYEPKR
jgi:glucose/arabinose dehydrogenase